MDKFEMNKKRNDNYIKKNIKPKFECADKFYIILLTDTVGCFYFTLFMLLMKIVYNLFF